MAFCVFCVNLSSARRLVWSRGGTLCILTVETQDPSLTVFTHFGLGSLAWHWGHALFQSSPCIFWCRCVCLFSFWSSCPIRSLWCKSTLWYWMLLIFISLINCRHYCVTGIVALILCPGWLRIVYALYYCLCNLDEILQEGTQYKNSFIISRFLTSHRKSYWSDTAYCIQ